MKGEMDDNQFLGRFYVEEMRKAMSSAEFESLYWNQPPWEEKLKSRGDYVFPDLQEFPRIKSVRSTFEDLGLPYNPNSGMQAFSDYDEVLEALRHLNIYVHRGVEQDCKILQAAPVASHGPHFVAKWVFSQKGSLLIFMFDPDRKCE
jgi:hypothetical protein